jgi:hypothetical protein
MTHNYGFIHEKTEIKILILFIMRRLMEPVTLDALSDLVLRDEGIHYFDYADSLAELVKSGHLSVDGKTCSLTAKGARNGSITETNLPNSVRMDAENAVTGYRAQLVRNSMVEASHADNPGGGCTVKLTLADKSGGIFSLEMYASDEVHAQCLEEGFHQNAEKVYNALLGAILE